LTISQLKNKANFAYYSAYMKLEDRIQTLGKWGELIKERSTSDQYLLAFKKAYQLNPWFIPDFIKKSLAVIVDNYLNETKLQQWVSPYKIYADNPSRSVALVMAGNIPLVGFHDLLSVLISGHKAIIKVSSKDQVLPALLHQQLGEISPELQENIKFTKKHTEFDAAIATGSDTSAHIFRYLYKNVPHIIRRNRNSVAILNGNESKQELDYLASDILCYFGLGCRSISKIFIPEGYNFEPLLSAFNHYDFVMNYEKYMNNYRYYKSIYKVNGDAFLDNGFILLHEDLAFSSPISVVYYEKYNSFENLKNVLDEHKDHLQIVVGEHNAFIPCIPFGSSQHPELWDYADQTDTLQFLLNL